jgi:serine/threonine protein kinase/Tol biopolymer transport system component
MGEVYLAEDTRLGRKVALKLLPAGLASDEQAKSRFTKEARAASALNHPHIITIYDIGSEGAHAFIAMEYIEGESLRSLISGERVEIKRAIQLIEQAASGLAAAHEAGIFHRDIKPENLMVTRGSQLKILDFGLAKLIERKKAILATELTTATHLKATDAGETEAGTILGTVSYMSPEQAQGHALDHRTDIFSLGIVLHELLTRRRPFEGKSAIDVLHAIINTEPRPAIELNPLLPSAVTEILGKALAKEVSERYQHAGDFELDLRRLKREIESNSPVRLMPGDSPAKSSAVRARSSVHRLIVPALIFAIVALSGVVAYLLSGRSSGAATRGWSTARTIATRLTNHGGREASGALSPDGKSFVFVSEHGGTPDIWLRQIAGGEPVPLTHDAAEESAPIYAPDGETIYFTRMDDTGPAIWRVGLLGGQPRRIVSDARMPVPSPDGRSLAYFVGDSDGIGDTLVVSALDGSGSRPLVQGVLGGGLIVRPAWSPDGRHLSYVQRGLFMPGNLFNVEVGTGQSRQVTQFTQSGEGVESQAWLPDNRHLVVSYVPQRTFFQTDLGVLDTQDGSISRLTFNIAQSFNSLSVSADGSRVIASADQNRREVWKVPLGPDPEANGRAAVRVLDNSHDAMWTFVSRDGRALLFNNAVTGTRNLWMMPLDKSPTPRQITAIAGDNVMHSSLSPDGSRVAFASRATGNSDIWTQNVDGSGLRQLTSDEAADSWPVWSPDGEWIVFGSIRDGRSETWLVPAAGGQSEKVMDGFFRGDWIRQPTGTGTWLVSSIQPGGIRLVDFERRTVLWEERLKGRYPLSMPMFSPDGHFISVPFQETRDRDAIWLYEAETGKPHLAVKFPEAFKIIFRACWVDDGKALVVNRQQEISHIVLFDRFWIKEEDQN